MERASHLQKQCNSMMDLLYARAQDGPGTSGLGWDRAPRCLLAGVAGQGVWRCYVMRMQRQRQCLVLLPGTLPCTWVL